MANDVMELLKKIALSSKENLEIIGIQILMKLWEIPEIYQFPDYNKKCWSNCEWIREIIRTRKIRWRNRYN